MINKKEKGNTIQRTFAKYLQYLGYRTEVVRNTRFNHGDYFGIADIIAINDKHWLVVQIKSNNPRSANREMMEAEFPPGTIRWVAVKYDSEGGGKPARWRIKNITTGDVMVLNECDMKEMSE